MSKFLDKIGDYDGPLTYTISGTGLTTRASKDDDTDSIEDTALSYADEDTAKLNLYNDRDRVLQMKAVAEQRLEDINREISAMNVPLTGYTPPPVVEP